jgi:ribonucleotide monophosphatase NagD (HAD superfamily)
VVGLEFATGVGRILGKPSPGLPAAWSPACGPRGVPPVGLAMVGDDLRADVAAAQRVGMKGILVLSGKHRRGRGRPCDTRCARPDGIGATLADVVAAAADW